MRVTQRMITNKTINVLQQGMSNVARAQEQVYSGVKINRLSDDPAGLSQTMTIQRNLSLNYQFQRNIKDGIGWLDQTDTALKYANSSVLVVARDLAVQIKNGSYEGGNRLDAAKEIDSLINALLDQAANASLGDKYIFAGLKNNISPFIRIGDNFIFRGDTSDVLRRIASGSNGVYSINASGYDVFYNKLVNLTKAAGSQITDVDIISKQNTVSSFGAVDLSGPLYGKMVLNIDGVHYTVKFDGEQTEGDVLAKINTELRNTNAVASIGADGVLSIGPRSDSKYKDFSINVVSVDVKSQRVEIASSEALNISNWTVLNGKKLELEINGNPPYIVNFSGFSSSATDAENLANLLEQINDELGTEGKAYVDGSGRLIISASLNSTIKVTDIGGLADVLHIQEGQEGAVAEVEGLNMAAGFNTLQYGKYRLSTVSEVSPGNATALVTDYYSQAGNTILGNVGVAGTNDLNSSVLMEVIDVKYTNERAEISSSGSLKINTWDEAYWNSYIKDQQFELEIDGKELTVKFTDFDNSISAKDNLVYQINKALEGYGKAYIDENGVLTLSSDSADVSSTIKVTNIATADDPAVDPPLLAQVLKLEPNQSGAVGVDEVTVKFSYNTYDKEGNIYQGTVVQTFKDTRTDIIDPSTGKNIGTNPKDGVPNFPETVTLGDGAGHNIELSINLTRFVQTGDKAVITVTAQADSGNAGLGVNYDGKDRNWVFNTGIFAEEGLDLKFFTLDEGNGESYDGNIYFETNGAVSTISEAVTFTAGNVFDALVYMRKKLENNEQAKMDTCMDAIDEYINNFLSTLVTIGARTSQFKEEYSNYSMLEVNLQNSMESYYSADYATSVVQYQEMVNRLEASMSTCSSILGLSLLNYLR